MNFYELSIKWNLDSLFSQIGFDRLIHTTERNDVLFMFISFAVK